MGMLSSMAYDYDNAPVSNAKASSVASFFNNTVYYFYTEATVRSEIDGIWGGMYNNIANLNNLILQIDGKKDIFTADNFNRVKGEAMALRALFHFDLARMLPLCAFMIWYTIGRPNPVPLLKEELNGTKRRFNSSWDKPTPVS